MICAYDKCEGIKEFEPKTHNQKYCSDECCRIATNEKLKQAYYEKKARLGGKQRICKTKECNVILSITIIRNKNQEYQKCNTLAYFLFQANT